MLLGGGRISYYLAKMIVPMGIHVSMIEINEKRPMTSANPCLMSM